MLPSPFADQGYDISDYYNINPVFGTLEDMDLLLAEAKKRDMYILLDLVVTTAQMSMSGSKKPARIRTENMVISSTLPTKKKATSMQLAQLLRWSCLGNSAGPSGQTVSARFPQKTAGSELGKPGSPRRNIQNITGGWIAVSAVSVSMQSLIQEKISICRLSGRSSGRPFQYSEYVERSYRNR